MGSIRSGGTTGTGGRVRSRQCAAAATVLLAGVALLGCTRQEPDVTLQQQVPAEMRTAEGESPADGGDPEPGGQAARFVAVDIDYEQAPSEIPAGPVTIELTNDGNIVHDVSFDELGGQAVVVADAGETASGDVELEPGTYTYFCSVPGHRSAGMEGTVDVTEQ